MPPGRQRPLIETRAVRRRADAVPETDSRPWAAPGIAPHPASRSGDWPARRDAPSGRVSKGPARTDASSYGCGLSSPFGGAGHALSIGSRAVERSVSSSSLCIGPHASHTAGLLLSGEVVSRSATLERAMAMPCPRTDGPLEPADMPRHSVPDRPGAVTGGIFAPDERSPDLPDGPGPSGVDDRAAGVARDVVRDRNGPADSSPPLFVALSAGSRARGRHPHGLVRGFAEGLARRAARDTRRGGRSAGGPRSLYAEPGLRLTPSTVNRPSSRCPRRSSACPRG
jgi:hypothetical protein